MKIALVNDSFLSNRGADRVVFELAKRLGRKHAVEVITTQADFPEENFRIKKIKGNPLLTGTWRDFLYFKTCWQFRQASYGYDIINLHHATLAPAFWGMSSIITTYHGSPFVELGERGIRYLARKLINRLGLFSIKKHRFIVAISHYIKAELMKYKIPPEKILVIYDAVGEEFYPTGEDEEYMLFVGRHYPHKRVEELIKLAFHFHYPLKIIGEGPQTQTLKALAKRLSAPVEFLGKVPFKDLIRYYQRCSFFISASCWEGFGLVFLEAARCGKPQIAFRIGSLPELIDQGRTGFMAQDFSEFKRYTGLLIKDKALRRKMGKLALKESQKFNWDNTVRAYCELFEKIGKTR